MELDDDPPLGAYLDEWLERRRNQIRPSALATYRGVVRRHLGPHLGSIPLPELDRRAIETFYVRLLDSGGRDGEPLSARTIQLVHAVLRTALKDAQLDGLIQTNPAAQARTPKRDLLATEVEDELQVWTSDQAAHFLECVDDHPLRALWHLALGTGARRGELVGLRWQDVDLRAGTVTVRRSLTVIDGVARLLRTKTSRSRRLTIGASVVDALERHRAEQAAQPVRAGDEGHDAWNLVFTTETGRYVHPSTLSWEFHDLVRTLSLPAIRLHDLRHTNASLLLELGVPVKVISERLGHATIVTTMDIYAPSDACHGSGGRGDSGCGRLRRRQSILTRMYELGNGAFPGPILRNDESASRNSPASIVAAARNRQFG